MERRGLLIAHYSNKKDERTREVGSYTYQGNNIFFIWRTN